MEDRQFGKRTAFFLCLFYGILNPMERNLNGLSFYKRRKKISHKAIHEIFGWILSVFITIFLGTALVVLFGMKTEVSGFSMEPVIKNSQPVLVDRFSYVLGKPKVGHVVLFLPNGNENSNYYAKRVVATPGDTVLIEAGHLYVNGVPSEIMTSFISEAGIAETELVLETGEYFVMGDKPSESEDSRSSGIGPVSVEDIVGKVWFKLPVQGGKMGFVK